ncbi:hypothetical protein BGX24_006797 [Mortierella sp. AD032]|nr:hypothetical protein BGX24_006797 [Mortierella sp. AD032]
MLTSDEDDGDEDDDDEDEGGSSEDSDGEDDVDDDRPMGFDSDDNDNGVLNDSDYEASDDETPLMKLLFAKNNNTNHYGSNLSNNNYNSSRNNSSNYPHDYLLKGPLQGYDVVRQPKSVDGGWQRYGHGTDCQHPYHSGRAVNGFKS